ncbi:TPA: EAL domain-containing protein [Photobacterium damselae]
MIKSEFKLYADIQDLLSAREKFYLIIVNLVDATTHKANIDRMQFTLMMHHISNWVLNAANGSMSDQTVRGYKYDEDHLVLLCIGQTNLEFKCQFTSILGNGFCHTTGSTSFCIDVGYSVAIYDAANADYSVQQIIDEAIKKNIYETVLGLTNESKYSFSKEELLQAMGNNELELWYQTMVDLKTGEEVAVESLLRWQHPKYGYISPLDMLCWFQFHGLQTKLDQWVIEKSFMKCVEWERSGNPTQIAVNIDGLTLAKNHHFIEQINEKLSRYGVNPSLISFEITETFNIEKDSRAYQSLIELSRLGFDLAIDDFGTGTSNISYLTYLPVNTVKLDKFFCSNLSYDALDSASILKLGTTKLKLTILMKKFLNKLNGNAPPADATSAMLSNLTRSTIDMLLVSNNKIVAEGIETKEQAVIMASLGCNIGQGYYFGKPEPR